MTHLFPPVIRVTRPGDINSLKSIDLKSYDYPLDMDGWRERIADSGKIDKPRIAVVTVNAQAVGYCMWLSDEKPEYGSEDGASGKILRLGVLPNYRRQGYGRMLMDEAIRHCGMMHCDNMKITVPAIHCMPGDPDDVSQFLNRCGYRPTGQVVEDFQKMFGDWIEGYVFERPTRVAS